MRVQFHVAALQEFRHERQFYNGKARGLGDRLIALVDEALAAIAQAPLSFPADEKHPRARRARLLGRFPHAVVFRVLDEQDTLVIIALEHPRRRPRYWVNRLRGR